MNFIYKTNSTSRYRFPTHINDLVMDRSEARFSEVFVVIVDPDNAPPIHKHDDTEQIFYILSGNGVLRIGEHGEETYEVEPGDIVRIPVSTWHSIKANNGSALKYLAVDCFGGIRNSDEPTWESHVKVLCEDQNWDYNSVKRNS